MFSFLKKESENSSQKGHLWIILAVAAIGIVFILVGGNLSAQEKDDTPSVYTPSEDELLTYQTYLENRVRGLCESVSGVSNVHVIVTLAGGFESVYATELEEDGEKYVILGSGSSAEALFLSRSAPKIIGIGIVCTGGGNANVRRELTSLLCAALDISSTRIYVTERGG